ncbi:MAG: MFS transporter [Pirellulales bacterium]
MASSSAGSSAAEPPPAWTDPSQATRNFLTLGAYQALLRVGWIFKTESVIIPAFLDRMAGPAWLRGLLPVLNRAGQSVPPLLLANWVQRLPQKKRGVTLCTLLMTAGLLGMSALWLVHHQEQPRWLAAAFLACYFGFFSAHGVSQLCYNTLQSKVIAPTRRGRLLLCSDVVGTLVAVAFALWLLAPWLALPGGGFDRVFTFAGCVFLLAAFVPALAREPRLAGEMVKHDSTAHAGGGVLSLLRGDRNFRRLAAVTALFSTVQILFPHYQALALTRLGLPPVSMLGWVVAQNLSVGLFSLVAGNVSDRYGTLLSLRLLIVCGALSPLVALGIASAGAEAAQAWYWVVFVPVGFTPLAMKTLNLYTLEIARPGQEAHYLSAVSLALALPFVVSPGVGWLVDHLGFAPVFLCGAAVILTAGLLTFRLIEPRTRLPLAAAESSEGLEFD